MLDISNPAAPVLVGTTLITDATFSQAGGVGAVAALSLDNGLFAVSGGIVNGKPVEADGVKASITGPTKYELKVGVIPMRSNPIPSRARRQQPVQRR